MQTAVPAYRAYDGLSAALVACTETQCDTVLLCCYDPHKETILAAYHQSLRMAVPKLLYDVVSAADSKHRYAV